jgi:hypothetical protein
MANYNIYRAKTQTIPKKLKETLEKESYPYDLAIYGTSKKDNIVCSVHCNSHDCPEAIDLLIPIVKRFIGINYSDYNIEIYNNFFNHYIVIRPKKEEGV